MDSFISKECVGERIGTFALIETLKIISLHEDYMSEKAIPLGS